MKRDTKIQLFEFLFMKDSKNKDDLLSRQRYVNKRSRTVFHKKNYLHCCYFMWELFICNK